MNKLVVTLAAIALVISGCSSEKKTQIREVIKVQDILNNSSLKTNEKAEKVALAAEQLFGSNPMAFMHVNTLLDVALSVDKNNKRAQLFKAIIAPYMKLKGSLARIKPLAQSNPTYQENYDKAVENVTKTQPKDIVNFLLQGNGDVKTETDAQRLADEFVSGFSEARQFFKKNRDLKITVTAPISFSHSMIKRYQLCSVEVDANGDITYQDCSKDQKATRTFDLADNMAVEQMMASAVVFGSLYNAYNIGDGNGANLVKAHQENLYNNEIYPILATNAKFGTIRNVGALKAITEMGLDGIKAVRYALENQKNLCPELPIGTYVRDTKTAVPISKKELEERSNLPWWHHPSMSEVEFKNRRPGYVFNEGFCLEDQRQDGDTVTAILKTLERAFLGETISVTANPHWEAATYAGAKPQKFDVNPSVFLAGKVADLKTFKPKFNRCDGLRRIADGYAGGIFPNGDANDFIDVKATPCYYFNVEGEEGHFQSRPFQNE